MNPEKPTLPHPPAAISAALLALVALGFLLQTLGPAPVKAGPSDAMVYWEASKAMQRGENNIYDTGGWESFGRPYIYPPAFAALFAPFTWFDDRPAMDPMERGLLRPYPFPTSLYVWVALIGAMWGCAVWLVARALGDGLRQRLWLAAVASVCLWGAFYLDAKFGNINTLILLMLAGGLALVFKGKVWAGGMILGAAAMIKVMPAALIVIFALQRNWKTCAAMVAGAALLWLAPLAVTIPNHGVLGGLAANFEMTWEWITRWLLPSAQTTKFAINTPYAYNNHSVNAALHRLFGEGTQLKRMIWDQDDLGPLLFSLPKPLLTAVGMLVPVSMFGAAVYAACKRRETHMQWGMAGLAFIAASAANVLFWHYHFVAFVLPVAAAVAVARTRADTWLAWVGIGSLFVLALGPNVAAAGFGSLPAVRMMVWCVPTLGFVIGWCCLWACLWRSSPAQPAAE
jgi:hypothetical protein